MDDLQFNGSIKSGEVVILKSQVNRAFTTSMEVGTKVGSFPNELYLLLEVNSID